VGEEKTTKKKTLQKVIIRVWYHELGSEYIMPDRCKVVFKACGGSTKY
jgi:hypothetical protein